MRRPRCASWWQGSRKRCGSIAALVAVLLTTIAAAAVWIVMLSLGIKPFDALLVAIAMVLLAGAAHVFAPYLPGAKRRAKPTDRYTPR
jgi:hypothetical protein